MEFLKDLSFYSVHLKLRNFQYVFSCIQFIILTHHASIDFSSLQIRMEGASNRNFSSFAKVSFPTPAQDSVASSENEERQLARVKSDFCPITLACRPAFFLLWVFLGVGRARRSINSLKLGSSNERKSSSIWGWWLAGLEIGRKMKREKGGLEQGWEGVHRGDGASPSEMDGG